MYESEDMADMADYNYISKVAWKYTLKTQAYLLNLTFTWLFAILIVYFLLFHLKINQAVAFRQYSNDRKQTWLEQHILE